MPKALITHKTSSNSRLTYTYKSVMPGNDICIKPGEDGVTEVDIDILHKMDDSEVYYNLKTPTESYDTYSDDKGNSTVDRHIELSYWDASCADEPPMIERLHEIVESLPERQKQAYELVYVWEFKENIAAEMMGISPAAVTKLLNKAKEKIASDEILKNFFRGG